MTSNIEKLELKSEKVRNIIGQIPPLITRLGITLIFFIISGVLIGSYFFNYEYTIKTLAQIEQTNDTTRIQIRIPANKIEKVKEGQKVILSFDNIPNPYNKRLEVQIMSLPTTIYLLGQSAYYNLVIEVLGNPKIVNGNEIIIVGKIEVKAEISCGKTSLIKELWKN